MKMTLILLLVFSTFAQADWTGIGNCPTTEKETVTSGTTTGGGLGAEGHAQDDATKACQAAQGNYANLSQCDYSCTGSWFFSGSCTWTLSAIKSATTPIYSLNRQTTKLLDSVFDDTQGLRVLSQLDSLARNEWILPGTYRLASDGSVLSHVTFPAGSRLEQILSDDTWLISDESGKNLSWYGKDGTLKQTVSVDPRYDFFHATPLAGGAVGIIEERIEQNQPIDQKLFRARYLDSTGKETLQTYLTRTWGYGGPNITAGFGDDVWIMDDQGGTMSVISPETPTQTVYPVFNTTTVDWSMTKIPSLSTNTMSFYLNNGEPAQDVFVKIDQNHVATSIAVPNDFLLGYSGGGQGEFAATPIVDSLGDLRAFLMIDSYGDQATKSRIKFYKDGKQTNSVDIAGGANGSITLLDNGMLVVESFPVDSTGVVSNSVVTLMDLEGNQYYQAILDDYKNNPASLSTPGAYVGVSLSGGTTFNRLRASIDGSYSQADYHLSLEKISFVQNGCNYDYQKKAL